MSTGSLPAPLSTSPMYQIGKATRGTKGITPLPQTNPVNTLHAKIGNFKLPRLSMAAVGTFNFYIEPIHIPVDSSKSSKMQNVTIR